MSVARAAACALAIASAASAAACGHQLPPNYAMGSEPPGGVLSAVVGPERPRSTIRVAVRDLGGVDPGPFATVAIGVVIGGMPGYGFSTDAATGDAPGTWIAHDERRPASALPEIVGWGLVTIPAGEEIALAPLPTGMDLWLQVVCRGNYVDDLLPRKPNRLIDVTVALECTSSSDLPRQVAWRR
jgi:hypothetical protein